MAIGLALIQASHSVFMQFNKVVEKSYAFLNYLIGVSNTTDEIASTPFQISGNDLSVTDNFGRLTQVEKPKFSTDEKVRTSTYIHDGVPVEHIENSVYALTTPREERADNFFDVINHAIKWDGLAIDVSGKGREENITSQKLIVPRESYSVLSMNESISNADLDNYLSRKKIGIDSDYVTKSIFLHAKATKNDAEQKIEKEYLFNAFDKEAMYAFNEDNKDLIVPVRIGNDSSKKTSGHWLNIRLSKSDNNGIVVVIENTTSEILNKKLSEIVKEYSKEVVSPILDVLRNKVTIDSETIHYCESRQYGNRGCGITTALNIIRGYSQNPNNFLNTEDQEENISEETLEVDVGNGNFEYFKNDKVTYTLTKEAENKINKSNFLTEVLMRVDIQKSILS